MRTSTRTLLQVLAVLALSALAGCGDDEGGTSTTGGEVPRKPMFLVANSRGDDVLQFEQETGKFVNVFIAKGTGGLSHPDSLALGPEGDLYISSGDTAEDSAILRFDSSTGEFFGAFAKGGGLHRPYGLAFGSDGMLYVASFLTDQILRYDGATGDFVDVFKEGDGMPGGLNGPNGLIFGPDEKLYVTTQGSVAENGMPTFPGLPSQVLRIDVATGEMAVFADQPPLSEAGHGYVSLLGLAYGPDCNAGICDLYVSDYANDIRRYDFATGMVLGTLSTNYSGATPSKNYLGALSFGDGGHIFAVGFDVDEAKGHPGTVLRFDAEGKPLPAEGQSGAVLVNADARLARPIGILALP
ncbi:PEP-CTERM sorting domain-containing protein [Polyangium spumosum]|uniref:PEP-CTERM sorting domain-containing protein n=1 Tax=Polyangium spumosum TaxID=889282 RepID=A0A6N7PNS8_9BACT|nr:PEP-CTERM sorting domain-containing protein [Polyangium spumosum]MRG93822.1 PEP-CTERM sorting domain-containing protein [Polyangium spumosum]